MELSNWLEARCARLATRWMDEVRTRYDVSTKGINGLLDEFLSLLVAHVPAMLGPHRELVEPLWIRGAELFGALAARRGLAAGEVIEEFQILRESVIRLIYVDPPGGGRARVSLRDILRLNRILDMGVTYASVGHTDALFFSLFEGSGIPETPPPKDLVAEVRAQLDDIRAELVEVVGRVPGTPEEDDGR